MPIPSNDLSLCAAISLRIAVMIGLNRLVRIGRQRHHVLRHNLAAQIGDRNRRLRRVNIQRNHRALMIQFKKGRPAPTRQAPVEPSRIHFSLIRSSTISETVLRCSPETRARSARESGCRVRTEIEDKVSVNLRAASCSKRSACE